MKLSLLFTAIYLLIIFWVLAMTTVFVRRIPDQRQGFQERYVWIFKDHPVEQKLTPSHNGLNTIVLYLRNPGIVNLDNFEFSLWQEKTLLRKIPINGANVGDGDMVRFQFDPVPDSQNKTYTILLTAETPVGDQAIGAGFTDKNGGSLVYETYYRPTNRLASLAEVFAKILANLLDWKLWIMVLGLVVGVRRWLLSQSCYKIGS